MPNPDFVALTVNLQLWDMYMLVVVSSDGPENSVAPPEFMFCILGGQVHVLSLRESSSQSSSEDLLSGDSVAGGQPCEQKEVQYTFFQFLYKVM